MTGTMAVTEWAMLVDDDSDAVAVALQLQDDT
jgi:hypothetical protein